MNMFIGHKSVYVAGDSSWCTHCGKSWDTGDPDPPNCKPVQIEGSYRIDKNTLQYSDMTVCEICGTQWTNNRTHVHKCSPNFEVHIDGRQQGKTVRREIALIGFLAAKLACYEPDSDTVKQALEYLKNVRF